MGVLNVTPDSFSDGGRYHAPESAVQQGRWMAQMGAAMIDVGGESTRPGADPVSAQEELIRTIPVIRALSAELKIPISIDTSKAIVAREAVQAGASIINDVSALRADADMLRVVLESRASVILMHMLGNPRTMQQHPSYANVSAEVAQFLSAAAAELRQKGMAADRIWLDPGLGFGKTPEHNLVLMRELNRLVDLGYPVLVGPSRKSFIGAVTGAPVESRLPGTLACVDQAARHGAHVVRVHDVAEVSQFLRMQQAFVIDENPTE